MWGKSLIYTNKANICLYFQTESVSIKQNYLFQKYPESWESWIKRTDLVILFKLVIQNQIEPCIIYLCFRWVFLSNPIQHEPWITLGLKFPIYSLVLNSCLLCFDSNRVSRAGRKNISTKWLLGRQTLKFLSNKLE